MGQIIAQLNPRQLPPAVCDSLMPVGVSGNRGEGQSNGSQPPGMDNGSTQAAVADGAQAIRHNYAEGTPIIG